MIIRRITILIVAASLALLCGRTLAANAISVSKIDGYDSTNGGLMANTPIRYYVHFQVEFDVAGVLNGFRIYSPDSATWQPLVLKELVNVDSLFDGTAGLPNFLFASVDGMGADTVMTLGFRNHGPGLVAGFDEDYFLIETSLSEEQIGKTLCLDSSFLDPNPWLWFSFEGNPAWDGPHCFEIVDCCAGNRGDVNGDGVGPNVLDLTLLVDYVFRGAPAPDCQLESDVNGDGMPYNIIDLTFVVDFIFRSGQPAPACPN